MNLKLHKRTIQRLMKTNCKMDINRDEIAGLIIQLNYSEYSAAPMIIREIDSFIQWAWENWPESLVGPYYQGEKPLLPTEKFIYDWIENEDFEADGFDIETLSEF